MADSDDEDYIFVGTPLEEQVEGKAGLRPKPVKDASQTRSLPIHKQEVTDEQGRRRFHGAFTGGFSAGYYNTVGSQEGWAPATFKSSRADRASARKQEVEDFLDGDELEDVRKQTLQTTADYDTFGSTAAEVARRTATADAQDRPSAALGLLPAELIAPVADSIGIRLLQKMGWRQGRGIGTGTSEPAGTDGGGRHSRWGRVGGVGVDNVPIYELPPKTDVYGLGFDPYKDAEEFRGVKRERDNARGDNSEGLHTAKRARGVAFGSGVLDEDDAYGIMDDYVTREGAKNEDLNFEIASDEEPDDLVAARKAGKDALYRLPGRAEEPHLLQSRDQLQKKHDLVAGFVRAAAPLPPRFFPPPQLPPDFQPYHRFPAEPTQGPEAAAAGEEAAAAPTDEALQKAIETLARFVARVGPAMEALAASRNAGDPAFRFLTPGGEGAEYFRARVAALRGAARMAAPGVGQRSAPLTADDRGVLLGEARLPEQATAARLPAAPLAAAAQAPDITGIAAGDRDALRTSLASTFTAASSDGDGPAVKGGLRPGGAKAAGPGPGAGGGAPGAAAPPPEAAAAFLASLGGRFASTGTVDFALTGGLQQPSAPKPTEAPADTRRPTRRVEEWRPDPLLCKRFNVPDPYKGRPAELRMSRFKTDHLALPETSAAALAAALPPPLPEANALPPPPPRPPGGQAMTPQTAGDTSQMADAFLSSLGLEPAVPEQALRASAQLPAASGELPAASGQALPPPPGLEDAEPLGFVEKPIDLFKAIFEASDSEEEEEEEAEIEIEKTRSDPEEGGAAERGRGEPVIEGKSLGANPGPEADVAASSDRGANGLREMEALRQRALAASAAAVEERRVPTAGRTVESELAGERKRSRAGGEISGRDSAGERKGYPTAGEIRERDPEEERQRSGQEAGRAAAGEMNDTTPMGRRRQPSSVDDGRQRREPMIVSAERKRSELSTADREQLAAIAAALKRVKKEERKKKRKGRDKKKKDSKDAKKKGDKQKDKRAKKGGKSAGKQRSASPMQRSGSDDSASSGD